MNNFIDAEFLFSSSVFLSLFIPSKKFFEPLSISGDRTEISLIKFNSSPKSARYGNKGFINLVESSIDLKNEGKINSQFFLKISASVSPSFN